MELLQALDGSVLLFLQETVRCAPLSALLLPLSLAGNAGILWIALCALLLCFKRTRKAGWLGLTSLLLCFLVNNCLLKVLVARPRPYTVLPTLEVIVNRPHDWSFPSGHACSSFAAACSLWRSLREKRLDWLRWCALIVAFLIAFSRLYAGVHYPTDVLCGSLIGFIGSGLVWRYLSRPYDRLEEKIRSR